MEEEPKPLGDRVGSPLARDEIAGGRPVEGVGVWSPVALLLAVRGLGPG